MNEKKVYLVFPTEEEHSGSFRTIFSSYEEAIAFTQKFKENTKFTIKEKGIDTPFIIDKERSAYCVTFLGEEYEYYDSCLLDVGEFVDLSIKNHYDIYQDAKSQEGLDEFCMHLLASDLEEAIVIARKKRDELLVSGKIRRMVWQAK